MSRDHIYPSSPGITSLLINNRPVLLTSVLEVAEKELMGDFASSWPLTKVLDIGGSERRPNYTAKIKNDEMFGESNNSLYRLKFLSFL